MGSAVLTLFLPGLIRVFPVEANSTELNEQTPDPVVIFMPEISKTHLGGTMRLGLRPTVFQKDTEWSIVRQLYGGNETIWERHRHRWEINPEYVQRIEGKGLSFVGRDVRGERMQVAELKREMSTSAVRGECSHFRRQNHNIRTMSECKRTLNSALGR